MFCQQWNKRKLWFRRPDFREDAFRASKEDPRDHFSPDVSVLVRVSAPQLRFVLWRGLSNVLFIQLNGLCHIDQNWLYQRHVREFKGQRAYEHIQ